MNKVQGVAATLRPTRARRRTATGRAGTRGRLGSFGEGQEAARTGGAADDAKTLAVEFDGARSEFKPWREVCAEMKRHGFPDWPLNTPASLPHFCEYAERAGLAPTG